MKRTLAGLAAAILLPAGIVAALGTPAAAAPAAPAAAPTANAASPAMLTALQRDLRLTEAQARARISTDSNASRIELKLRKQLGKAFAGAWLTADATSFVVAVTDSRRAAEVTAAGATPKVVARGRRHPRRGQGRPRPAPPPRPRPRPCRAGTSTCTTNTVVVLARGGTAAARAFIRASGVDRRGRPGGRLHRDPAAAVRRPRRRRLLHRRRALLGRLLGQRRLRHRRPLRHPGHRDPGLQPGRAGHLPGLLVPGQRLRLGRGRTATGPRSRG